MDTESIYQNKNIFIDCFTGSRWTSSIKVFGGIRTDTLTELFEVKTQI